MADAVNPYRLWLEIDTDATNLNHYELLDLTIFEEDLEKIHHAADRAAARVRSHRPGAHAAAWARLLDDIAQAKNCLSDAQQKAAYDARLREEQAAAQPAPKSAKGPEVAEVNQLPDLFPPGMEPVHGESPAPAPKPAPAAARSAATPTDETTSKIRPAPAAGKNPPAPTRPAASSHQKPPPPPSDEKAVARAGRLLDDPFDEAVTGGTGLSDTVPAAPVNAHVAPPREQKSSILPMALVVIAIVVVITVVVGFLAAQRGLLGGGPATPGAQPAAPGSENRQRVTAQNRSAAAQRTTQQVTPNSSQTRQPVTMGSYQNQLSPGNAKAPSGKMSGGDPPPKTHDTFDQDVVPASAVVTETGTSDEPSDALESSTGQAAEDPGPASALADPATLRQLSRALTAAQVALGKHDFQQARQQVKAASALAASDDHKSMVAGVAELTDHANKFWMTVASQLQRFQGAEELTFGSGELIVSVVESSPNSITIHMAGKNMRYELAEMPPGLALAIAKLQLDLNNPDHLLQLGACLATVSDRKPVYLDEARKYWEQAEALGADVSQLLRTLTDSY